ncbi:Z1 domain-containing protein [Klenkia taihuensis]|uniref:Z1 domain-containing protein n=1 Tax=Klenkia taihuensis TaxID=1225127 RepID=A0A1I1PX74_9ACTN|nr:Z1 domain-containing protein [Klenkia taihuensis]GHE08375.1 endonuclease [Klenkia taihuensis]SFD14511.1 Z1 domain-containing protein [Klenkia taihuensis]
MTTGTDEQVDQLYQVFLRFTQSMTPHDAVKNLQLFGADASIIRAVRERHDAESLKIRNLDEPSSVFLDGRQTWYTGPDMENDRNWPALESTMQRKGFGSENVASIDKSSTKIVALLEHPKQDTFRTRGLVVGFVQSGKTTNFTAVMAKAADRGYRLFIVLSGIHNTLRRQTQIRLVKDLVEANPGQWHQVTSETHDFVPPPNPKAFFASTDQRLLLVVKKNAAVLRKLRTWLANAGEYLEDCPTLIIDDEADQSTVATSKINPLLFDVLAKFPRVGYVGYTATPFANLLIDPSVEEDFYPRDFIVNLPQPDGYHGAEVLFGRDLLDGEDPADLPGGHDMIRTVPDDEVADLKPRNKKEASTFQPALTHSLQAAVEWFWLATAARRVRGGGNPHSTMLVHTTTETLVHEAFKDPLLSFRSSTLARLERNDERTIDRLRSTWERETGLVPSAGFGEQPIAFEAVLESMSAVVRDTRIIIDNYRSTDRLNYESGPVTAIAIGGNTLSRGLTLEGLVSSLFVRAVSAYDTLLQMGRWFGYRTGYGDLPRIWMTDELKEWFSHLATVEADMRRDIDRYMHNPAETPLTFAVRLRSHPKMSITAKAKMKSAVLAHAAYGGTLVESRFFDVSPGGAEILASNAAAARSLIGDAQRHGVRETPPREETALFTQVPHDDVKAFLLKYAFDERSSDGDRTRLIEYIAKRVSKGALGQWSVAVVGNSRPGATTLRCDLGNEVAVRMVKRSRLGHHSDPVLDAVADIKTLSSRRDETIDLVVDGEDIGSRDQILGLRNAQRPDQGLLLIYPIEPESNTDRAGRVPLAAPTDDVVVGVALVFPKPRPGTSDSDVEYWSADLSNVVVEEEDLSVLEQDDEAA